MKVKVAGTVVVAIPGKNGHEDPLPGASVCVTDKTGDKITSIPCVTTGASGAFEFSLVSGTRVVIEFQKAGYGSQLIAVDVGTADIARGDVRLSPPVSGDAGDAGNGPTYGWDPSVVLDPAKGLVNVIAVQPSGSPDAGAAAPGLDFTTGLTLSVSPKSGVGPYYVAPDETWASTATKTAGGYGAWFLNLTPGDYKASASSPDLDCVPIGSNGYGWPNTDGTSGFPIIAGFNTQSIGFYCVPKVSDAGHD